ncbi:MAG: (Fe-S)-binding protein [Candidatus Thorarchaeota archaeon]|nr:(Fe-S)-binding protein [Candidatus Thorarchaeota archaeon]
MTEEQLDSLLRMCAACPKMCRHVCPTFFAWRSDSPTPHGRALLLHQEAMGVRDLDERAIDVLYQCLECSHCLTWCLPGVDIAQAVEKARVRLVEAGTYPPALDGLRDAVHQHHNPFGEPHEHRTEWQTDRGIEGARIAYFVGCTASYRERNIARSTSRLLSEFLGLDIVVTGDEWCCGSPLLRTGFAEEAKALAEHNTEVFNSLEVYSIVTSCPGCFRALTKDYASLGVMIDTPVVHLSQLLYSHLDTLPRGSVDSDITYHDPCHLGRHSGIYDEPRVVIERVSGRPVVEMERNRENASCCGNGAGLRLLYPTAARAIGAERVLHAQRTGARYLVTACPFCKNLLDSESEDKLAVFDLSEFLLHALREHRSAPR